MSAINLIRPDLKRINNYKPGGDEANCRLHANELPWPPIANGLAINQYPDECKANQLQQQLAQFYQIPPSQIVLTRGSDDGIDQLMRLFLRPGQDSILQCPPTFPMYVFYAQLQNAGIINCPLDAENDFALDIDKLIASWQPDCKLVMLCQPNNPTGNLIALNDIISLARFFRDKAIVVVDEAYIEFANIDSATRLIDQFDNLVVLRTLSKAYGMAGLRLGSVIAQSPVIDALQSIIPPYHLPAPVLAQALQALENKSWFQHRIEIILEQRHRLQSALNEFSWVEKIYPSEANFLMIQSALAPSLFHWLAKNDIAVRGFGSSTVLASMLRITIGSPQQNDQLLDVLSQFKY